jgi:cytosine/adenosine deaminase-related metal-dependent hydrolase
MDDDMLTRRGLIGSAAAIGATGLVGGTTIAQAQAPSTAPALPVAGEFLIRDAHVLSMDPAIGDLPRGDVHVRAGAIVAVGPNLTAPAAQVIDGRSMIALPGLIETHWHMWGAVARNMAGETEPTGYFPFSRVLGMQFTAQDNARGVRLALAEAIYSGITTVHNWSHNLLSPAYADAELAVHREVGGRARFGYGYSRNTGADETLPLDDVARVQREWFSGGDGLLTLGIASRGPESNTLDICRREWDTARRLGIPITCHIGTHPIDSTVNAGILQSHRVDGIAVLDEAKLLGPDVLLVHATWSSDRNMERLAATGTPVSLSPFTELRTGFGITPIDRFLKFSVSVSLSVDTTLLCGNADMFAIMKAMQNIADGVAPSEFAIDPRRVLQMATIDGAQALGIGDKVGSLTPGKRADLILVRTTDLNVAPLTEPVRMIVQSAQPMNVDLVMVDGRILKRDGKLTTIDAAKVVADAAETINRVRAVVKM